MGDLMMRAAQVVDWCCQHYSLHSTTHSENLHSKENKKTRNRGL